MLTLQDIHFSLDGKKILDSVSVRFDAARIHGVIGPNGSGKSTMLKNICRIWQPQTGTIFIDDRDYRTISRKDLSTLITMVPQNTSITFPISVYDVVSMGRNPHLGRFDLLRKKDREIIDRALQETHIYHLKDRIINELSGGEAQLAIIARALVTEAPIILLDEPTSDLDVKHTLSIIYILSTLKEKGKTILMTVHDLNLARRFCDTISILNHGTLFYTGSPEGAFSENTIRQVFEVNVKEFKHDSTVFLNFYI
ncbi:MAG TPA: ABC transporter ATP-binding protein [Thermodesulfobacteriota bacterium]|nr:ABC transporter ATP-binding protein [Thermodesulfobacteriota bacterium]HNU71110.1 ABC transporter ATP-binding protein [Thermodesulfobacteriota bacterium]